MQEPLLDGLTLAADGNFIASMITIHGMRGASNGYFLVLIMVRVGVPTSGALSLLPVILGIM
jgi:hypothetical protein